MAQEVILGIGIIVYLFFVLFDRLDEEQHFLLRFFIILFNIIFMFLIPVHLMGKPVLVLFYRLFMAWIGLVSAYFMYFFVIGLLNHLGFMISERKGKK